MESSSHSWLPRHKLTVADYHRMGQAGLLREDDRVELVEGEIIDLTPIGSYHASAVNLLVRLFSAVIGENAILSVQAPIALSARSELQPDLVLALPREDFYRFAHPGPTDVLLLIEVADTSLSYDREVKMPLYARHGIPELWLVDLENRRLEVFRQPKNDRYVEHEILEQPVRAAPQRLPQCEVELSGLW